MIRSSRWVIPAFLVAAGCSSLEAYRVQEPVGNYATIESNVPPMRERLDLDFEGFYVQSIDRRRIDMGSYGLKKPESNAGMPKRAVVLSTGPHKVHIMACESKIFSMNGYICGEVILTLYAVPGQRYLANGSIAKSKDFADIWIEDRRTGDVVSGPLRVSGLD
jgi:hypothetical protein